MVSSPVLVVLLPGYSFVFVIEACICKLFLFAKLLIPACHTIGVASKLLVRATSDHAFMCSKLTLCVNNHLQP